MYILFKNDGEKDKGKSIKCLEFQSRYKIWCGARKKWQDTCRAKWNEVKSDDFILQGFFKQMQAEIVANKERQAELLKKRRVMFGLPSVKPKKIKLNESNPSQSKPKLGLFPASGLMISNPKDSKLNIRKVSSVKKPGANSTENKPSSREAKNSVEVKAEIESKK